MVGEEGAEFFFGVAAAFFAPSVRLFFFGFVFRSSLSNVLSPKFFYRWFRLLLFFLPCVRVIA